MYGLALLNSDYTGDCVTVRRASDNATTNIGFDGQDLDIASLELFCSGTDGFITTWHDQSGNANNAVQTTASSQPKIVSSGSVILENGKPTIDFDGTDDCFDLTNNFSSIVTISQFVVLTPNSDAVDEAFTSIQDNGTTNGIGLGQGNYGTDNQFGLRSIQTVTSTVSILMSVQQYLLSGLTTATTAKLYANNIQGALAGGARLNATGNSQIAAHGSSGFTFSGNMQSVVIYDSDQSGNRIGIETALNDYYNIF